MYYRQKDYNIIIYTIKYKCPLYVFNKKPCGTCFKNNSTVNSYYKYNIIF